MFCRRVENKGIMSSRALSLWFRRNECWEWNTATLGTKNQGGIMNAARYCDTLTKLMSVTEAQKTLSRGVLFLDDNGRSNTATDTKEHIRRLGWDR
ncbi:hypothetical protein AVEN_197170-1 [Araneus ventricosus]|uniref:Uncharacterized protein n=1 Tax=Araneus ventricosus TaxID=182803 RepID=A0A4Y2I9M5_ARAVE|nr:hypothetical protein AVEN_197170-1 [Araneus ventricosus]